MANIRSIVNMHNKEVITEKKTQAVNCNCMNKPDCIIYKAKITSNLRNFHGKIYHGTSKHTFKQRYGNHKKFFEHKNIGQIQNFRRNTGDLKNSEHNLMYNFIF